MLLIGSKRLKQLYPDFNREPKDEDWVVGDNTLKGSKTVEFLYNPILIKYCEDNNLKEVNGDVLYTLKLSHTVGWRLENNSWDKHVWDITFLKDQGCNIIWSLFYDLHKFWESIHGVNKRSDLDMSAEEFFDNVVGYPIEHDYLHTLLIKHPYFEGQLEPTYKKILIGEVDVSMDKFHQLSEKQKFNVVFEEVAVMALERYEKLGFRRAYKRMLDKFIISHAKLPEAIWILENYKLISRPPFNYIEHLNKEINEQGINFTDRSARSTQEQVTI